MRLPARSIASCGSCCARNEARPLQQRRGLVQHRSCGGRAAVGGCCSLFIRVPPRAVEDVCDAFFSLASRSYSREPVSRARPHRHPRTPPRTFTTASRPATHHCRFPASVPLWRGTRPSLPEWRRRLSTGRIPGTIRYGGSINARGVRRGAAGKFAEEEGLWTGEIAP